jgi:phage shock protein PspC (stress-responsive transcriptional regulator)
MKKVVTIHLANDVFQIEEDGYLLLQRVLGNIKRRSINEYNQAESIIAEYFRTILNSGKQVITYDNVVEVLKNKGYNDNSGSQNYTNGYQRLYRRSDDRVLGGVCSGLGNYWKVDPILIRILFLVLFFGFGMGLLVYLIMWIVIPKA